MKIDRLKIALGLFSLMFVMLTSCQDESDLRLHALDNIPPSPPKLVKVSNINGGAVVYFEAPSDRDLLYVEATYEINGVVRTTKSSAYRDSLSLDGFGSEGEYKVQLTSVDQSRNVSTPVEVTVNPLEPPVNLVFKTLKVTEVFGGIRISWTNSSEANVVVIVNTKDSIGDWVPLHDAYSAVKDGMVAIRDLDAIKQEFQLYVRDRWNNYSEKTELARTPLFEEELDKEKFKYIELPGDADPNPHGTYPPENMWDGMINDDGGWVSGDGNIGKFITFDLGVEIQMSRFKLFQRTWGNHVGVMYNHCNMKHYMVYGVKEMTDEMEDGDIKHWGEPFHEAWTHKPSGDGSQLTNEDIAYALLGDDQEISMDAPTVRYLRIHLLETWSGSTLPQIGELTFWGQIIK